MANPVFEPGPLYPESNVLPLYFLTKLCSFAALGEGMVER